MRQFRADRRKLIASILLYRIEMFQTARCGNREGLPVNGNAHDAGLAAEVKKDFIKRLEAQERVEPAYAWLELSSKAKGEDQLTMMSDWFYRARRVFEARRHHPFIDHECIQSARFEHSTRPTRRQNEG